MSAPESKRIKELKRTIAKEIPKFPNTRKTLQILENKPLGDLLIAYFNWAFRYIPPRRRRVIIKNTASSDPRWEKHQLSIMSLLQKAQNGENLNPYLSEKVYKRAFTPAPKGVIADYDKWADKDFILNAYSYHHLHLDALKESQSRSDDMIFVYVTREELQVIGIFNHNVFKPTTISGNITEERDRFLRIVESRNVQNSGGVSFNVEQLITTSGHKTLLNLEAMKCAKIIISTDHKLDFPEYVDSIYESSSMPKPVNYKVRWHFNYLDLGLLLGDQPYFTVIKKGII
jgi:hypothetical protein